MTSQDPQIQTLINEIDEILSKPSPRLPWVMAGEADHQRQVLSQTRDYLITLQAQLQAGERSLTSPVAVGSSYAAEQAESAQQVLQAVLQEMSYLRSSVMYSLRNDIEQLQQQREALREEIQGLQAQQQQALPSQTVANQQQLITDFLHSLMARLQENLTGQVAQMLTPLEAQLSQERALLSDRSPGGEPNYATASLLTPQQRLEQIQMLQRQSDQLLLKLDTTLRVIFESLQSNIQSYQDSLGQGLDKMHSLGQQGEAMFSALISGLAQRLGKEASTYLQSSLQSPEWGTPPLPAAPPQPATGLQVSPGEPIPLEGLLSEDVGSEDIGEEQIDLLLNELNMGNPMTIIQSPVTSMQPAPTDLSSANLPTATEDGLPTGRATPSPNPFADLDDLDDDITFFQIDQPLTSFRLNQEDDDDERTVFQINEAMLPSRSAEEESVASLALEALDSTELRDIDESALHLLNQLPDTPPDDSAELAVSDVAADAMDAIAPANDGTDELFELMFGTTVEDGEEDEIPAPVDQHRAEARVEESVPPVETPTALSTAEVADGAIAELNLVDELFGGLPDPGQTSAAVEGTGDSSTESLMDLLGEPLDLAEVGSTPLARLTTQDDPQLGDDEEIETITSLADLIEVDAPPPEIDPDLTDVLHTSTAASYTDDDSFVPAPPDEVLLVEDEPELERKEDLQLDDTTLSQLTADLSNFETMAPTPDVDTVDTTEETAGVEPLPFPEINELEKEANWPPASASTSGLTSPSIDLAPSLALPDDQLASSADTPILFAEDANATPDVGAVFDAADSPNAPFTLPEDTTSEGTTAPDTSDGSLTLPFATPQALVDLFGDEDTLASVTSEALEVEAEPIAELSDLFIPADEVVEAAPVPEPATAEALSALFGEEDTSESEAIATSAAMEVEEEPIAELSDLFALSDSAAETAPAAEPATAEALSALFGEEDTPGGELEADRPSEDLPSLFVVSEEPIEAAVPLASDDESVNLLRDLFFVEPDSTDSIETVEGVGTDMAVSEVDTEPAASQEGTFVALDNLFSDDDSGFFADEAIAGVPDVTDGEPLAAEIVAEPAPPTAASSRTEQLLAGLSANHTPDFLTPTDVPDDASGMTLEELEQAVNAAENQLEPETATLQEPLPTSEAMIPPSGNLVISATDDWDETLVLDPSSITPPATLFAQDTALPLPAIPIDDLNLDTDQSDAKPTELDLLFTEEPPPPPTALDLFDSPEESLPPTLSSMTDDAETNAFTLEGLADELFEDVPTARPDEGADVETETGWTIESAFDALGTAPPPPADFDASANTPLAASSQEEEEKKNLVLPEQVSSVLEALLPQTDRPDDVADPPVHLFESVVEIDDRSDPPAPEDRASVDHGTESLGTELLDSGDRSEAAEATSVALFDIGSVEEKNTAPLVPLDDMEGLEEDRSRTTLPENSVDVGDRPLSTDLTEWGDELGDVPPAPRLDAEELDWVDPPTLPERSQTTNFLSDPETSEILNELGEVLNLDGLNDNAALLENLEEEELLPSDMLELSEELGIDPQELEALLESDFASADQGPPGEQPHLEPTPKIWYLGIDVGTTGISAVLLNRLTCDAYPIYWSQVHASGDADKSFRLSTQVFLSPDDTLTDETDPTPGFLPHSNLVTVAFNPPLAEEERDRLLDPIAPDRGFCLKDFKPYLTLGIPYYSPETGCWEPILQWSDQHPLSLSPIHQALRALLATLSHTPTANLTPPIPTSGALGLDNTIFQAALRQLAGVIVGYPVGWSDTYHFNLREAVLGARLVTRSDQIFCLPDCVATLLAGLPAGDGRAIALPPGLGQPHLYNSAWQGPTLVINAGASVTDLAVVHLPEHMQQLTNQAFHYRSLPYAGNAIDQDIVCHLIYPAWLEQSRQSPIHPDGESPLDYTFGSGDRSRPGTFVDGWHWQPVDPATRPTLWSLLGFDTLALPQAGEPDGVKRAELRRRLTIPQGQSLLEAARYLKLTLQQQDRFVLKLGDQQLTLMRQDLGSRIFLPYIQRLNREINALLAQLSLTPSAIAQVICTGGTASLGAIARWLHEKFANATLIQDTYGGDRSTLARENYLPTCSRVAYGLATLPLHPTVLDTARQQYSDYFLLLELLRLFPDHPLSVGGIMQLLEQQGINTQLCHTQILALLDGQLPEGLVPIQSAAYLLTPESRANPDYRMLLVAPLFYKHDNQTYRMNYEQWHHFRRYLSTLMASTHQKLSEPIAVTL